MSYLEQLKNLKCAGMGTDETIETPRKGNIDGFVGGVPGASENFSALRERIESMAKRWGYPADELENALSLAKQDPAVWLKLVEHDEATQ